MSNFLTKIKANLATEHRSHFDLSCDHITTSEVNQYRPIYFNEFLPGSKINISMSSITRLFPLLRPVYGSMKMRSYGFFVPLRTVMPTFNEFYEDTPSHFDNQASVVQSAPFITNQVLVQLFANTSTGAAKFVSSASVFDFTASFNGTVHNYEYTPLGLQYKAILEGLGYQINFNKSDNSKMSVLPIFAYALCVEDWLINTSLETFSLTRLLIDTYKDGSGVIAADLASLLNLCVGVYRRADIFNQAWNNPVSPNGSSTSSISIDDPTVKFSTPSGLERSTKVGTEPFTAYTKDPNSTPTVHNVINETASAGSGQAIVGISQFAIDALKAVTDFVVRKRLPGFRALDRYYAQYGLKLPSDSLNRTKYLGDFVTNVEIGDITSNNGADVDTFGDFAGKGFSSGRGGHFSYDTDEFGYFIIINAIVPRQPIVSGRKRYLFHLDRLSFYQPEFDNLSVQAIRNDEVMSQYNSWDADVLGSKAGHTFGFMNRFYEYKVGNDYLTGTFTRPLYRNSMAPFHMFRQFAENSIPVLNDQFKKAQASDLDRIWNSGSSLGDHFINYFHFDVQVSAPCSQLFDNYHFEEAGRKITYQINGTNLSN